MTDKAVPYSRETDMRRSRIAVRVLFLIEMVLSGLILVNWGWKIWLCFGGFGLIVRIGGCFDDWSMMLQGKRRCPHQYIYAPPEGDD